MAISNLSNLMTIEGVGQVANAAETAAQALISQLQQQDGTEALINQTIVTLQNAIKILQSYEANFLKMLNCSSKQQFQFKINKYLTSNNLFSFTGANLQKILEEYQAGVNGMTAANIETTKQIINSIKKTCPEAAEKGAKFLAKKVLTTLSKGQHTGLRKIEFLQEDLAGNLNIVARQMTPAFIQALDRYRKNANIEIEPGNTTESSITINIGLEWHSIISSATKGKTGKGSDVIDDKALTEASQKITDLILNELNLNGGARDFARERITEMLAANPKMFFVGKSLTQLEGILGEISTYMALVDLLGENFSSNIISWIGSDTSGASHKQPSVDIALGDIARQHNGIIYGVQVKNTIKELSDSEGHYISFANKPIEEILQMAGINSQAIEELYISRAFNVPYKMKGRKYAEVTNLNSSHNGPRFPEFLTVYEQSKRVESQINIYLTQFAPNLLYMGIDNQLQSTLATIQQNSGLYGNFLYVVGNQVFFASDMLTEINKELSLLKEIKELSEQMSIKITPYLEDKKQQSFNIISVKNGKSLNNYSKNGNARIKSAYGFKSH